MSIRFLELFGGALQFRGDVIQSIEGKEFNSLEKEYSISMWVYLEKVLKNRKVTVLHKGDETCSQPNISLLEKTLVVKLDCQRNGSESLIAATDLQLKKWTHLALCVKQEDITEVSFYLNGKMDSEIAVNNPILKNESKCYIGKDPWSHGLRGSIAEPLFFFNFLSAEEVQKMYLHGCENWKTTNTFGSTDLFYEQKIQLNSTFPSEMNPPVLLETPLKTKQLGTESEVVSSFEKLDKFFYQNPKMLPRVAQLVDYFDWLFTIYRILRSGMPTYKDDEGNLEDKIEVDRMLPPMRQVKLHFTRKELVEIGKVLGCHQVVNYNEDQQWNDLVTDDIINYLVFLETLRDYVDLVEFGEEFHRPSLEPEERYGHLYKVAEEFLESKGGNFEILMDYCTNCASHQTTTWHDQREYALWYNEIYAKLLDEFPACEIVGNKYGPPAIGGFGVYIEGIGNPKLRDRLDRLKLYKVKNKKPSAQEIIDAVCLLAYIYKDTLELAQLQQKFREEHGEKNRHPDSHNETAPIPEPARVTYKKKRVEYEPDEELYCRNWACQNKVYINMKNHKKACRYHPGRWEFGSIHALWPENWTCCRGDWESPGCTYGFHRGIPNSKVPKQCVNRGEPNPNTKAPDSVCGITFPDPSTCGKKYKPAQDECKYHAGYKQFKQGLYVWSCCGQEEDPKLPEFTYCVESTHRFVDWPDEEAKIYFVTKVNSNPAVSKETRTSFAQSAKTSRFFNPEIKPYTNPKERRKMMESLANEPRHCLNHACETVYKESENHEKACKCHTGYWDFGHSGILKARETIVLWEPHWRCCGGKWEDPGCKLTRHCGPLVSKMPERKWKWPSEGAKRYFMKKVSKLWQDKLKTENLTRRQVERKYDQVCKESNCLNLPSDLLHRLCLALHLHILCVSDDISFMFKYQDVISREAERILSDKQGNINKEAFLDWWFAPIEKIRPEMAESN